MTLTEARRGRYNARSVPYGPTDRSKLPLGRIRVSARTDETRKDTMDTADFIAHSPDLRTALFWHLTCNHYPALPTSLIPACEQAIDAANEDDWQALIALPDGCLWRNQSEAPAWAIIQGHHLHDFIDNPQW